MFVDVSSAIPTWIQNVLKVNVHFAIRIRRHLIVLIDFLQRIHMNRSVSTAKCPGHPRSNANNIVVFEVRLDTFVMLSIHIGTIGCLKSGKRKTISSKDIVGTCLLMFYNTMWRAYIFVNNSHGFSLDNYTAMRSTAIWRFDSDRRIPSSTNGCASRILQRNSATSVADSNEKPSVSASITTSSIHFWALVSLRDF